MIDVAACPVQWTERRDTHSQFAERNDAYRTLSSCQDYCAGQPDCVAVDFDFNDNSCWVHRNQDNLVDDFYRENTHQYRIDRECATGTTTTASTTTSSTTGL